MYNVGGLNITQGSCNRKSETEESDSEWMYKNGALKSKRQGQWHSICAS